MKDPESLLHAEMPVQPTLLVVDDQPTNLRLLFGMLAADYRLLAASDAEGALRIAAEQRPDLILMDVVMPGMSGLDACRQLRQQADTRDIPVIFITSGDTADEESACWEAGGVDFIPKPLNGMTVQRRVAVHVRLKQQADQLRQFARTDWLTGIANRRVFDSELLLAWRRCERNMKTLTLAIVDVDWFKGYNDHYGHQAGDEALRSVARTLAAGFKRPGDLVARLGGEEFGVLAADTSEADTVSLLQRAVRALQSLCIQHAGSPLGYLTLSSGVAAIVPRQGGGSAELIELADRRLYRAKAKGRNQIVGSMQDDSA